MKTGIEQEIAETAETENSASSASSCKSVERPILFSGEMVRAILEGRKTQTRRILKPQPIQVHDIQDRRKQKKGDLFIGPDIMPTGDSNGLVIGVAENNGTTRWIGQNFCEEYCPYGKTGDRLWVKETFRAIKNAKGKMQNVEYRATASIPDGPWKPSIFMPRWASRILLEITGIKVQRLGEMKDEDARAEGCCGVCSAAFGLPSFKYIWESINGKGSWENNPWVWVIQFKRLKAEG